MAGMQLDSIPLAATMTQLAAVLTSAKAGMLCVLVILYMVATAFYNLYLHPLARFPGPWLWCASRLPWVNGYVNGHLVHDILRLHEEFGPVVRIAPNELAFIDADAWKDIYGHKPSLEENVKYPPFYMKAGSTPNDILGETKENHRALRRSLASGFSDRSMHAQESMIAQYIDLLIRRLREYCQGTDGDTGMTVRKPLDMKTWYNWTTFDVIGDLCFGESFGLLEKAQYDPWVESINQSTQQVAIAQSMSYLGFSWLVNLCFKFMGKAVEEHNAKTKAKIQRRMKVPTERLDLIEPLLKKAETMELSSAQVTANAGTILAAGSETTATLLTGVTYLLLKNPESLKKVTEEVRSSFQSNEEITLLSVSKLHYMLACLDEAMRCYPPVALGLPRQIPKGGATIAGHFLAEGTVVSIFHWAAYHTTMNWHDPFSYRPERFLPDADPVYAHDKTDALQPFSVGPRNCIGKNLAIAEMRQILARILYNFDLELAHPEMDWLEPSYQKGYFLWDKPPMEVFLTPVRR